LASVPGGGTLPGVELPSAGVALRGDHLAALRAWRRPVIARVEQGTTLIDLRTVDPDDDSEVASALSSARSEERRVGEDGRDFHVTGVQTCALPISWPRCRAAAPCRVSSCPRRGWRCVATTSPPCGPGAARSSLASSRAPRSSTCAPSTPTTTARWPPPSARLDRKSVG